MRRGLVVATLSALVAGCGQRGPLHLPTTPAAADRATLPEVLIPGTPTLPAPVPGAIPPPPGGSGTGTAAPVRTP